MNEKKGKVASRECRVARKGKGQEIMKRIDGTATLDDLALLEEMCDVVKQTSLCGLGQSAPNPVLTVLKYFPGEVD